MTATSRRRRALNELRPIGAITRAAGPGQRQASPPRRVRNTACCAPHPSSRACRAGWLGEGRLGDHRRVRLAAARH